MIGTYFAVTVVTADFGSRTGFMNTSFSSHFNVDYIENMFAAYQQDPNSVEPSWRYFFEGMAFADKMGSTASPSVDLRVHELIRGYRKWGHLSAKLDPLGRPRATNHQLNLENFGFVQSDREELFPTGGLLPQPRACLKELIAALEKTYCGHIGLEYLHGSDQEQEAWFQERVEPGFNQPDLHIDVKKKHIAEVK